MIEIKKINKKSLLINIDTKTKQGEIYEDVSDITAVAIPAYYQLKSTGSMTIHKELKKDDFASYIDEDGVVVYLDKKKNSIDEMNIPDLLLLSNEWITSVNGYVHKINQIKNYDWITEKNLDKCVKRLGKNISDKAQYHISLKNTNDDELQGKDLYDIIDCVDINKDDKCTNIWKFKCLDELKSEYFLHTALQMYLYCNKNGYSNCNFYLYNIITNDKYKIKSNKEKLKDLVDILIDYKFSNQGKINDEEFLENVENIKKKYN